MTGFPGRRPTSDRLPQHLMEVSFSTNSLSFSPHSIPPKKPCPPYRVARIKRKVRVDSDQSYSRCLPGLCTFACRLRVSKSQQVDKLAGLGGERVIACLLQSVTKNTFCFLNAASNMIKKAATRSSSEKAASTMMVSHANARNGHCNGSKMLSSAQ